MLLQEYTKNFVPFTVSIVSIFSVVIYGNFLVILVRWLQVWVIDGNYRYLRCLKTGCCHVLAGNAY